MLLRRQENGPCGSPPLRRDNATPVPDVLCSVTPVSMDGESRITDLKDLSERNALEGRLVARPQFVGQASRARGGRDAGSTEAQQMRLDLQVHDDYGPSVI